MGHVALTPSVSASCLISSGCDARSDAMEPKRTSIDYKQRESRRRMSGEMRNSNGAIHPAENLRLRSCPR